MIKELIAVVSLDTGNSGKGGIIHKLAKTNNASVVFKFGGAQSSHGVVRNDGQRFNFAHWGCATLEGIPTYLTSQFLVLPQTMVDEGRALQLLGIEDPYQFLYVDPRVLCVTSFHQIVEQLHALACQKQQPSTDWASGAKAAYCLSQKKGDDYTIRFSDLYNNVVLERKLDKIMRYYQLMLMEYDINLVAEADQARAKDLLNDLHHNYDLVCRGFLRAVDIICNSDLQIKPLTEAIRDYDGIAIAEFSQGVLADAKKGLQPDEGALRTLPKFAEDALYQAGFNGKITRLGVTKAYILRHGGISSPTVQSQDPQNLDDCKIMGDLVIPDPDEVAFRERWDSNLQTGPLDFVLLERAISLCGGPQAFDGLCITWMDQILKAGVWQYCDRYLQPYHMGSDGKVAEGAVDDVLPYISALYDLKYTPVGSKEFNQSVNNLFESKLGIPVKMISFGAKDSDKITL